MENHLITHHYQEVCPTVYDRGNIVDSTKAYKLAVDKCLNGPTGTAYRSMFHYDKSYLEYYQKNKTVRGYSGTLWATDLTIDIDDTCVENHANALTVTKNIVTQMMSVYLIEQNTIKIGFTGNRGFHILLPQALVGFPPSIYLPKQMAVFMKTVIAGCLLPTTKFDESIYGVNKIIRVPHSRHEKTGLYKIMLTSQELNSISGLPELQLLAKQRRPSPKYNQVPELNELLAELWPSESVFMKPARRDNRRAGRQAVAFSGTGKASSKLNQHQGINDLLCLDIRNGEGRNDAAFRIAIHYANRQTPTHIVEGVMDAWNKGLSDPLPDNELRRTTQSALGAAARRR